MKKFLLYILFLGNCICAAEMELLDSHLSSLAVWFDYYKNTPANSDVVQPPLFSLENLAGMLESAAESYIDFVDEAQLIDQTSRSFEESIHDDFMPFAEKVIIPRESKVFLWGDLHGDVQFLVRSLSQLKERNLLADDFKLDHACYMIFLGDLVDRGDYGAEILFLVALLRQQNPYNVIIIRGNHEHVAQNLMPEYFLSGMRNRYFGDLLTDDEEEDMANFENGILDVFYNTLPVVLYLGIDTYFQKFIQCCHGGLEIGYDPVRLLSTASIIQEPVLQTITELNRMEGFRTTLLTNFAMAPQVYDAFLKGPQDHNGLGFMWSDFTAQGDQNISFITRRGEGIFSYGRTLTEAIIRSYSPYSIIAIIRGHQHNRTMSRLLDAINQNVYTLLWDIPVYTTIATTVIPQNEGTLAATYLELDTAGQSIANMIMTAWTYLPSEGHSWQFRQHPFLLWSNFSDHNSNNS